MAGHRLGPSICTTPGCPNDQPCPTHGQQGNWTPQRTPNRQAQNRLRLAVLARDDYRCTRGTRCVNAQNGQAHRDPTGKTLVAHHIKPGYELDAAITHCIDCHKEIDAHAR